MNFIEAKIKVVGATIQLIIEKQEDILFKFLNIDKWVIRSAHMPEINDRDKILYLKGDSTKKSSNIYTTKSRDSAIELAYTIQTVLTKLNEEYEYNPETRKFTRMGENPVDL